MKRSFLAMALSTTLILILAGTALAHSGDKEVAVEPTTVASGGSVTLTGGEFKPNSPVTISLDGIPTPLGTAKTGVDGDLDDVTVEIPTSIHQGYYSLVVEDSSGTKASVDLTITAIAQGQAANSSAETQPAMGDATAANGQMESASSSSGGATGWILLAAALAAACGVALVASEKLHAKATRVAGS